MHARVLKRLDLTQLQDLATSLRKALALASDADLEVHRAGGGKEQRDVTVTQDCGSIRTLTT
jgi:hypothetical protein